MPSRTPTGRGFPPKAFKTGTKKLGTDGKFYVVHQKSDGVKFWKPFSALKVKRKRQPNQKEKSIESKKKKSKTNINAIHFWENTLLQHKKNQSFDYRKRWSTAIKRNDITIKPCDLSSFFSGGTGFISKTEREGQSIALLGLGKLSRKDNWKLHEKPLRKAYEEWFADDNVAIKVSFNSKYPENNNSLQVENIIYISIIDNIVENNFTPCVITPISYYKCLDFGIEKQSKPVQRLIGELIELAKIRSEKNPMVWDVDTSGINVLFMEKSNGKAIGDWLPSQKPLKHEDMFSLFFQIVWTLQVFSEMRLIHNDLNPDNLLIDTLPSKQTMIFWKSTTEYFELSTNLRLSIFDFDRACVAPNLRKNATEMDKTLNAYASQIIAKTEINVLNTRKEISNVTNAEILAKEFGIDDGFIVNTLNNVLRTAGYWNEFQPESDFFQILDVFLDPPEKIDLSEKSKTMLNSVFYGNREKLAKYYLSWGKICSKKKEGDFPCDGPYVPNPKTEMKTTMQILNDETFSSLKKTKKQYKLKNVPSNNPNVFVLPSVLLSEMAKGRDFFKSLEDIPYNQ